MFARELARVLTAIAVVCGVLATALVILPTYLALRAVGGNADDRCGNIRDLVYSLLKPGVVLGLVALFAAFGALVVQHQPGTRVLTALTGRTALVLCIGLVPPAVLLVVFVIAKSRFDWRYCA